MHPRTLAIAIGMLTALVVLLLIVTVPPVRAETSVPIGHYEFCKTHTNECDINTTDEPIRLTEQIWAEIKAVNLAVNAIVEPMPDWMIYGEEEVWAYPLEIRSKTGEIIYVGDCEDYVLEKRRRLSSVVGLGNALITVVERSNGEGHAVLTIRTSRGELILDNLTDFVLSPAQTGYAFIKRQSSRNTGRWVSLLNKEMPNG